MKPRLLRRALVGLGTVVAVSALASPAFAHVEAEGATDADGTTTVTFSFTHGCGESPTTALKVQLPASASDVRPENPTGWTSNVTGSVLTWNGGTPVPNGTKGTFVATMKLTGATGETVFFPTVQTCAQGEETWIDKTTDPEAENAAPRVVLGATATAGDHDADTAGGDKATTTAAPATTARPATTAQPATTAKVESAASAPASSSGNSSTGLLIAIIAAVVVIVGIVVAVVLRRRSPS